MKKVASGKTVLYHYAGGNLIAETDENGVTLRDYIYLNGEPVALRIYGAQFGTVYYFVNDHLGTPQKIVDSTNQVVWAAAYFPFGKAQIKPETITNNLRFPGQYYDAESGLHYNRNRYYDPDTGRYLTADPIGLAGGVNLYVYVMGNPVNQDDPTGMYEIPPTPLAVTGTILISTAGVITIYVAASSFMTEFGVYGTIATTPFPGVPWSIYGPLYDLQSPAAQCVSRFHEKLHQGGMAYELEVYQETALELERILRKGSNPCTCSKLTAAEIYDLKEMRKKAHDEIRNKIGKQGYENWLLTHFGHIPMLYD